MTALGVAVMSCTIDKTDFEAELNTEIIEYVEFSEAVSINSDDYQISIEALNGTFYKGYNEIRLQLRNIQSNQDIENSEISFLPIITTYNDEVASCPHSYNLEYNDIEDYYSGYVVFTENSSDTESWMLYISFTVEGQIFTVTKDIIVEEQTNKNLNMTSFTGNDGEQYYIALVAPQAPEIGENELVAGIYKYQQPEEEAGDFPDPSQFTFSEAENYTLLLDPRMPEPSMGNHSSPNNQDLIQHEDGLYYGVVNYTMTGNWTLNFIMLNADGETIKGTEVPTDFTPGVEGVKSELYIDILF